MRLLVYGLFFLSGAVGLLYEVVWIRLASTVLGNTTYAVGTVVGVFMGGLALGAWRGGRAADRRRGASLLRLYGVLELAIAGSALAVPLLISALDPLFRALWNATGGGGPVYGTARIVATALVLVVPTTLMGATLPVLARWFAETVGSAAGAAGRAYGANTLGGVFGTLAAGFLLMPSLGVRATTLIAVALNAAIGAGALALARGRSGDVLPAPVPGEPPARLALVAAALSGCASLAYQVAWTRSLVLSMGSTVYSFTLILAGFILGLAAGGAVGGRIAARIRSPRAWLAASQAAIALVSLVLFPFLIDLPLDFAALVDRYRGSYAGLLTAQSGLIALFLLPPTFIMGAVFPLACRAASTSAGAEGRSVAAVYTANTVGSIVGTLGASFGIMPLWGVGATVACAAGLNVAGAGVLLWGLGGRGRITAVVLALLLAVGLAYPSGSLSVMSSGAYLYGSRELRGESGSVDLRTYLRRASVIKARHWDAYGLVTVHESEGFLSMRVNGKIDASTSPGDMRTQTYLSHLPLLHHPQAERVLVVGLGGGFTLGAAARYAEPKVLDCVEISPAVLKAAEHFAAANGNALKDPRVRMTLADGRQAVRHGREGWDVIICEPSNLWISGMANLFTRDFFEEARSALRPGGIFCQWVQAYRLGDEDFKSILRTFYDVFPAGSVWEMQPGADYVMMGTAAPMMTPLGDLERRLQAAVVGSPELEDPLQGPLGSLLGQLVGDADAVRRAAGPGRMQTDDLCAVEYSAPRMIYQDRRPATLAWLDSFRGEPAEARLYAGATGDVGERIAERRRSRREVARAAAIYAGPAPVELGPGYYDPRGADSMEALDAAKRRFGLDLLSHRMHEERGRELASLASESSEAGHPSIAARYLAAVPEGIGATALAKLQLGKILLESLRDVPGARAAYEAATRADPSSYAAAFGLAAVADLEGRTEDAVAGWRKVAQLRPRSIEAWLGKAVGLQRLGRTGEARAALQRALELDPNDRTVLELKKSLGVP